MAIERPTPHYNLQSFLMETLGQKAALNVLLNNEDPGHKKMISTCQKTVQSFSYYKTGMLVKTLLICAIQEDEDGATEMRNGALKLLDYVDFIKAEKLGDHVFEAIEIIRLKKTTAEGNLTSFIGALKLISPYLVENDFQNVIDELETLCIFYTGEESRYLKKQMSEIIPPTRTENTTGEV